MHQYQGRGVGVEWREHQTEVVGSRGSCGGQETADRARLTLGAQWKPVVFLAWILYSTEGIRHVYQVFYSFGISLAEDLQLQVKQIKGGGGAIFG